MKDQLNTLNTYFWNVGNDIADIRLLAEGALALFEGDAEPLHRLGMKNNEEVNISNPTEAQLQTINPYNFINLYKSGYASTLNTTDNAYVVHLTSNTKDQKIKELFITIDKQSYHPTKVKLLQGKSWTEFEISDLSKANLADSEFRFNAKDFPQAEVIDLR